MEGPLTFDGMAEDSVRFIERVVGGPARPAVIPGTSHGLMVEKPDLCNSILTDFLTLDAVATFAPIRCASA